MMLSGLDSIHGDGGSHCDRGNDADDVGHLPRCCGVGLTICECELCVEEALQCGTVHYCTVQCRMVQYSVVKYSVGWHSTLWDSTVQYCTAQCGTVEDGTVRYDGCGVLCHVMRPY